MNKKVSLICTTFNCRNELDISLLKFTSDVLLSLLDEIVIVDGGSSDGTWQLLQKWAGKVEKLKIYQVPGANISKGRNEAIKRTNSDIIVCFDSGTTYSDNWLKEITAVFNCGDVAIAGASTIPYGNTRFEKCLMAFYDRQTSDHKSHEPSHRGFAMRREVWERIGGYPEHVQAGEDTWFNSQWKKLGYKYVHVPAAYNYWKVRSTAEQVFRMQRRNTRGHIAIGERASFKQLLAKTLINLFFWSSLAIGFSIFKPVVLIAGSGIYFVYFMWRLLGKRRWRNLLINPVNFIISTYILLIWELGTTLGFLEGSIDFICIRFFRRKF